MGRNRCEQCSRCKRLNPAKDVTNIKYHIKGEIGAGAHGGVNVVVRVISVTVEPL